MNKNTKQAEAVKVTTAPTERAETTELKLLKPGTEPEAEEATAQVIEHKRGLNLDQTLKIIEDLHLKKRHRDKLENSLDQLNAFEVEQKEEDLSESNYYQGCSIALEDDKRNKWSTKNPGLIKEVIDFMNVRFTEKLTELEASIVLPH